MAWIYVYPPGETDFAGIGAVGALMDEDAVFELRAGEFGELSFRHPLDRWGKWRALQQGAVLKTMVPLRLCPEVTGDGSYVESVDEYAVAATATRNQRYIYSKRKGGEKKKLLKTGAKVTVTGVGDAGDDQSRYRVKCGRVSGWMDRAGLSILRRAVPVAGGPEGLEALEPSYALRQQLFRIVSVEPTSDGGGRIGVRALRIAYDLLGNVTDYRENGSVSCREACEGILSHALLPHDFSVRTDIGDERAGFDAVDLNPVAALLDPERGAAARWDGQVIADDYEICLLRRAGMDRGVSIRYGGNLAGVEMNVDASGAVGAVRPVGEGKDGSPLYLDGRLVNGRWGYNWDARQGACGDWLPEGYAFYTDPNGGVNGTMVCRAGTDVTGAEVLRCDGCKVESNAGGVTAKVARRRMANQAVAKLEAGCDVPTVSLDVDFVLLGDTEAYRQYRHLEPLFVYDTVRVVHGPLGISVEAALTSIRWLVRQERVAAASFGSLRDVSARVCGWQIRGGVNGAKLIPGSVDGGALGSGCVSERHIQADSVNAEAIQANSLTAETAVVQQLNAMSLQALEAKLNSVTAQTIVTDTLAAAVANLMHVAAQDIEAGRITTDTLAAVLANLVTVQAKVGTFDLSTVQNLVSSALTLQRGQANSMYITNLAVTSANLLNVTVGKLVIKGEDGSYYEVGVGADGVIRTARYDATAAEISAGVTTDGRQIVEETINAETITGKNVSAEESTFNRVLTSALSAGKITASEAMLASASIPMLYVTSIKSLGDTIDISANETIKLQAGRMNSMAMLDDEGLHVGRAVLDEDGNYQIDEDGNPIFSTKEVLIREESVDIREAGKTFSRFAGDYVQFGNYQLRKSTDGGLVFKMKEE